MLSYGALQTSSTAGGGSGSSTVTGTFTWDYLNRLSQVSASGSTSVYSYDPSNERIKSVVTTSSTATTRYPTKFYNITNGIPTKHVFANGVMIATISGSGSTSTVSSILTDHLTGASVVTNASGTISELSDYLPLGGIRIDDKIPFNEQRKFAGQTFFVYFSFHFAKNSELDQFFGSPTPVSTLMPSSWQTSHSGMVSGEQRSPPLVKICGLSRLSPSRTVISSGSVVMKGMT
jgi:hypothetical protein